MRPVEILKVVFLGIVEGITEWLPISSTGHMILFERFLSLGVAEELREAFFVIIQLGAVAAVPVVFWHRLFPFGRKRGREERAATLRLWLLVLLGIIPAGFIGLLFDELLFDKLYNPICVALSLILFGIVFIVVERIKAGRSDRLLSVYSLSSGDALKIGLWQTLALVPGVSRSGSTIVGGMLCGASRSTAAEFSFFLSFPIILAASGLKALKLALVGVAVGREEVALLLIGIAVSFFVSLATIKFLMGFTKRHTLAAFGVYRIILGVAVLSLSL